MKTISIQEAERAIQKASRAQQRRFLARLPRLLLSLETYSLLKSVEPSFAFWDNAADEVYDEL